MDPSTKAMTTSGNGAPAVLSTPSDHFLSKLPGEIRNAIYQLLLDDLTHDQPGPELHTSTSAALTTCLRLCGVNKQIRTEFGGALNDHQYAVALDEVPAFFAAFFPRQCLTAPCNHSHITQPKKIRIKAAKSSVFSKAYYNLTDIFLAKAHFRDLQIEVPDEVFLLSHHRGRGLSESQINGLEIDGLDFLLSLLHDTPSPLLDGFQNGFIKRIKFLPRPHSGLVECDVWQLRLNNVADKLSKEEQELTHEYCGHLWDPSRYASSKVYVHVQDARGLFKKELEYCGVCDQITAKTGAASHCYSRLKRRL